MNCGEVASNLIADKKIPVMIAVFVGPGTLRGSVSNLSKLDNSDCESFMPSPRYADFITGEILPFVETLSAGSSRRIVLSKRSTDRMIGGVGAGANAVFWAACRRPGVFSRVFAGFGAESAELACHGEVEISEPRRLRAFFSGVRCATVEAVGASGCGMEFQNCGERHVRAQADMVFPEAMEFLWRGWPELPVPARESENAELKSLLMPESPFASVRAFGGADAYGRVYAASGDGIRVYGPGGGRALAVLSVPGGRRPVSLAWGGADSNILYVLCSDSEGVPRRLKTEFAGGPPRLRAYCPRRAELWPGGV